MSLETLLVITNLPDRASAETLARALVERRAAACVNILAPCRSVYRWQGAVERISGITRYETAAAVAAKSPSNRVRSARMRFIFRGGFPPPPTRDKPAARRRVGPR